MFLMVTSGLSNPEKDEFHKQNTIVLWSSDLQEMINPFAFTAFLLKNGKSYHP